MQHITNISFPSPSLRRHLMSNQRSTKIFQGKKSSRSMYRRPQYPPSSAKPQSNRAFHPPHNLHRTCPLLQPRRTK
uniref:Uncharacterized protein n=1 Tax=Ciona savignyi TaxID=51511 RepID=H2ZI40_CIOSA